MNLERSFVIRFFLWHLTRSLCMFFEILWETRTEFSSSKLEPCTYVFALCFYHIFSAPCFLHCKKLSTLYAFSGRFILKSIWARMNSMLFGWEVGIKALRWLSSGRLENYVIGERVSKRFRALWFIFLCRRGSTNGNLFLPSWTLKYENIMRLEPFFIHYPRYHFLEDSTVFCNDDVHTLFYSGPVHATQISCVYIAIFIYRNT